MYESEPTEIETQAEDCLRALVGKGNLWGVNGEAAAIYLVLLALEKVEQVSYTRMEGVRHALLTECEILLDQDEENEQIFLFKSEECKTALLTAAKKLKLRFLDIEA